MTYGPADWHVYARLSYELQFGNGVRLKATPRRRSPVMRALMRPGRCFDLTLYQGLGQRPSWRS